MKINCGYQYCSNILTLDLHFTMLHKFTFLQARCLKFRRTISIGIKQVISSQTDDEAKSVRALKYIVFPHLTNSVSDVSGHKYKTFFVNSLTVVLSVNCANIPMELVT